MVTTVVLALVDMLKLAKMNISHSTSTMTNGLRERIGGLGEQGQAGLFEIVADRERARLQGGLQRAAGRHLAPAGPDTVISCVAGLDDCA